jgi:PKD repeat protein
VNFQGSTNSQYPTQFSWDFGDGTSGSSQIVSHTYATIGSYNAVLITLDSIGCSYTYSQIINIYDCSHSISLWNSGFEVGLHGYMSNNQSAEFLWDLGDGFTSTDQWLYHMYTLPGTYNISLQTITADNCVFISDTIITVPYGCDSWLIVGTGSNVFEQSFQGFIANNYPTEFLWEFGDGDSGSGQNITHIYPAYGTYFCSLTTIDSTGCTDVNYMPIIITSDTTNQGFCDNNIYIFNETGYTYGVHGYMTDNYDASYLWDMGDGSTYDLSFFYHTYPGPGIYNVMLQTITEDSCIDINYTTVHVLDSIPNDCSSYFSATATNNLYEIHFEGSTTSPYPATFLWNFGDPASGANNSSTLQNPNHTFSAAGTYSVTLTIVDSTNCTSIFSAPVILSLFSNYSLFGQVLAGNQSITDCKVQLFSQDYTGSMNMIEEVTPDSANYYKFDSVSSGIYHILAIPDPGTIYALQYLPTYFGDAFLWENSIPVVLGQPANPYPIHLVDFDSISGGDGMITGGLTAGGKSINVGNQEILILDINNIPVKYLFSEPDGTFSFAGLPYGEYKVYPVITGIKTYPVTVILSATNTSANVIMKISGQTVAGTGESEHYNIIENLYPNPASDVIAVSFKVKGMFRLQIIDASGKAVYIISEAIPTDGNDISIPISALKPGLYLLVVQDAAGNNTTRRFIKK